MIQKLLLASTSPRRRLLLTELGCEFEVVQPVSDESSVSTDPVIRVIENAEMKVRSIASVYPNSLILGADTVVFLEGQFLGKPMDVDDARRMLMMLSGKTHCVFTGVVLLDTSAGSIDKGASKTQVSFRELSEEVIEAYIASSEPMDKAGAYAIQGSAASFVVGVEGSWSNVVGLPLELVKALLEKFNP